MQLPRGFSTFAELEASNASLYPLFNSLVWHHVRKFQRRVGFSEDQAIEIAAELWLKLLRTSKPYRNPAGMNLIIVNRLKRTIREQGKWRVEEPSGICPEDGESAISAQEHHKSIMRSELQNLTTREFAVLSLFFHPLGTQRRWKINRVAIMLNRDRWWVERRIESAKEKLPALSALSQI